MHLLPYIANLRDIAVLFCFVVLLSSCEEETPKSSEKKIDQLVLTVGDTDTPVTFGADDNATLTVPYGTDLTAIMVKTLLVSAKATVSVAQGDVLTVTSGSATLTVTAEDGNKQIYTVSFTVTPPRTGAELTALTATISGQAYSSTGANPAVVITNNNIAITLPVGSTLPTNLPLTVLTLSPGASSVPAQGAALDLTAGVGTLTLTAEDGMTMGVYTVRVTIVPRTGVAITALTAMISGQSYSSMGANPAVVITNNNIAITLPSDVTLPTNLPLTGLTLSPGASSVPAQGATLTLTAGAATINVTAEDGMVMGVYTVRVTIALNTGAAITALTATISGQSYSSTGDSPAVVITSNTISLMVTTEITPFGSLLPVNVTLLTLSPGASSTLSEGDALDLTATGVGSVTVQAEDPTVAAVTYTITVSIINTAELMVTTYTGTDTLGIAVRDVVTEVGRSLSFSAMDTVIMVSGLADVSFDWALGTLRGTKAAMAGTLVLTQSDLGMFPAMADVTYALTVSANAQTSEGKDLFYYPGQLRTWRDLQGVRVDLAGTYRLMDDISFPDEDGDGVSEYNFEPLGRDIDVNMQFFQGVPFSGTFDGGGREANNLYINRGTESYVGLFGRLNGTVRNVGLVGGTVRGNTIVGGLVGNSNGMVQGVYATVAVTGGSSSGGLVGYNTGTVRGAYATGTVTASSFNIGGLLGYNSGTVQGAYATGTAMGNYNVGGLIGYNEIEIMVVGYSRGNVIRTVGSTDEFFGRLIGRVMNAATVTGYYSAQTGESQLLSLAANGSSTPLTGTIGFDGEARTSASVQADFASTNFEFGEEIGKWIYTAGRWPALYLGTLQSAADQPTQ